jgi:hypothetical protein
LPENFGSSSERKGINFVNSKAHPYVISKREKVPGVGHYDQTSGYGPVASIAGITAISK